MAMGKPVSIIAEINGLWFKVIPSGHLENDAKITSDLLNEKEEKYEEDPDISLAEGTAVNVHSYSALYNW